MGILIWEKAAYDTIIDVFIPTRGCEFEGKRLTDVDFTNALNRNFMLVINARITNSTKKRNRVVFMLIGYENVYYKN
jgi:hypothetical protein